jgi:nicotinamidase-related amidase
MSENPNLITIDNSALILIDQQPLVAFAVQSIDRSLLVNNVTGLAVAAEALGVPTVLTTVGAHGGPLSDPMFPPDQRGVPRPNAHRSCLDQRMARHQARSRSDR